MDRFEMQLKVCTDPDCRWVGLSDGEHFGRHNPPCGELFVGANSSEWMCSLLSGHGGPHRGDRVS